MPTRALVLGSGGVTGVAWETGLLAGLAEAGLDLRTADLIIGTSAGATVGAQLRSAAGYEHLYEAQLAESTEMLKRLGPMNTVRWARVLLRATDPQEAGIRFGRIALAAHTVSEETRRSIIASRLTDHEWPTQPLQIIAVNAESGEHRAFDAGSGVPLVDAIAASSAVPGVWPPATVDGDRWIDGGIRSAANADLATGYDRVVILAPNPRGGGPLAPVADQAAVLEENAQVAVISPDQTSRRAMGNNALDPSRRPVTARAGRAQAPAVLDTLRAIWAD